MAMPWPVHELPVNNPLSAHRATPNGYGPHSAQRLRCGNGKWRSLAARCVRDAEAGGSSPPFPTKGSEQRQIAGIGRG